MAACVPAALVLLVGGISLSRREERRDRRNAETELRSIAQLKTAQIAAWRAERLDDASMIVEDPSAAAEVARPADDVQ